jgi:hypothetical protein
LEIMGVLLVGVDHATTRDDVTILSNQVNLQNVIISFIVKASTNQSSFRLKAN